MTAEEELQLFHETHPWPEKENIDSLYRFSKVDDKNLGLLRELFVNRKLYHALPNQFNDPFECKPHFRWPSDAQKVKIIRKRLVRVGRERGSSRKEAEALVSKSMRKPGFIEESIYGAIQRTFSEMRICCFTKSKDNLLFWSHYADSHRGFCVEYDATILPVKYAFKVSYADDYPEVEYPRPTDARGLKPALLKSNAWSYEDEYRIIYIPEAKRQPDGDGESLVLPDGAIKNIYFGACVEKDSKDSVISLISEGPFSPDIWQATLSKSSYKLEFENESE